MASICALSSPAGFTVFLRVEYPTRSEARLVSACGDATDGIRTAATMMTSERNFIQLLLSRRYARSQFFEPVLDDDHAPRRRRCLFAGVAFLDHQEPLTVRRHVVRSEGRRRHRVLRVEDLDGIAEGEIAFRLNRYRHQRIVLVCKEQF